MRDIALHTHKHKKERAKLMTDDKMMMSIADEND